jgi:hypothetical protein
LTVLKDFIAIFAPIFAVIIIVILLVAGIMVPIDYVTCKGFGAGVGAETRWSLGCYVRKDGQWVPKDYYFGNAHELRIEEK